MGTWWRTRTAELGLGAVLRLPPWGWVNQHGPRGAYAPPPRGGPGVETVGPKGDQYTHPPTGPPSLRPTPSSLPAPTVGSACDAQPGPGCGNQGSAPPPPSPSPPPPSAVPSTQGHLLRCPSAWDPEASAHARPRPSGPPVPPARPSRTPPTRPPSIPAHRRWGAPRAPGMAGGVSPKRPRCKWRAGGDAPLWSRAGRRAARGHRRAPAPPAARRERLARRGRGARPAGARWGSCALRPRQQPTCARAASPRPRPRPPQPLPGARRPLFLCALRTNGAGQHRALRGSAPPWGGRGAGQEARRSRPAVV